MHRAPSKVLLKLVADQILGAAPHVRRVNLPAGLARLALAGLATSCLQADFPIEVSADS